MKNSNAVIIQAVIDALEATVMPAISGEATKSVGQLALTLLKVLLSRETQSPIETAQTLAVMDGLSAKMAAYIPVDGMAAAVCPDFDLEFINAEGVFGEGHRRLIAAQVKLARLAAQLVATRNASQRTSEVATINALLSEMAKTELVQTNAFFAGLARPAHTATPEPQLLNQRSLQQYVQARFPARKNLTVMDMAGSGFSMSKQILFFSILDESGIKEELVLRQEKPINWMQADCTRVSNEYELIKSAYEMGLPVPEPLWLETSPVLGPDFMVMRKIRGTQLGEPFKAFEPLSEDMIMQIGALMARLHGAGLAPFESFFRNTGQMAVLDMSAKEAVLHRIGSWEKNFSGPGQFPKPGKIWLFDWLKRNAPDIQDKPVMVHGDFNIHNLLVEGGQITTCLDWEWGHAGNALEDLGNVRHHVEKYSSWDRFVQHYRAHGGPEIDMNPNLLNYNRCLTNAIYSASGDALAWHVAKRDLLDLPSLYGSEFYSQEFHRVALEASLKNSGV